MRGGAKCVKRKRAYTLALTTKMEKGDGKEEEELCREKVRVLVNVEGMVRA